MQIELHAIPGMMVGFELITQDGITFLVVDLFIVRLLFIKGEL